jgi:hypothetical protein
LLHGKKVKNNRTLAQVEEAEIAYSIPVAVPGRGGCPIHKTFNITKPCSVWMRLAENPPIGLNLKDHYNIALLAAIVLFRVEY